MKDKDLDEWFNSVNALSKKRVHSPDTQSPNKKRPKPPRLHINIPQPAQHQFYPQPPLLTSRQSSAYCNNEVSHTYRDEHFQDPWEKLEKQYDNFLNACETSDPTLSSLLTPFQLSPKDRLEKAVLNVRKTLNDLDNVLVALRSKESQLGFK
jgi:hypothetical protein